MGLWKKLSMAAATGTAAFLATATVSIDSAQAAQFKFTFESENANGYFIYDDSVEAIYPGGPDYPLAEYDASVVEYSINVDGLVAEGKRGSQADPHDEARNIVYLGREGNFGYDGTVDDFILYIPPESRGEGEQYGLSVRFTYPEGTFSDSLAIRTSVPDTARLRIYPYWDYPYTTGDYTFEGTVTTKIEKVPEPASISAFLVAGSGFIFRRYRRKLIPAQA